eukprot:4154286-Pyramimonas_sp.AAC.1
MCVITDARLQDTTAVPWGRRFTSGGSPQWTEEGTWDGMVYSGGPFQETPCLPPGCPGFLRLRWFCNGKCGVPTPQIYGRPGVS